MQFFEGISHSKKLTKSISAKILKNVEFRQKFRQLFSNLDPQTQSLYDSIPFTSTPVESDWEITVLGTASMMPSTYRNVSSIMLTLLNRTKILFDCGEATLSQLHLQFGPFYEQVLMDIEVIIISHLHGDHFFGIFKLLDERQRVLEKYGIKDKPCHLILPRNSICFLFNYTRFIQKLDVNILCINDLRACPDSVCKYDYDDSVTFQEMAQNDAYVKAHKPHEPKSLRYKNPEEKNTLEHFYSIFPTSKSIPKFLQLFHELKIEKILFPRVMHCPDSFGIVVQANPLEKFVYSGDCRPSLELIRAGQKASLLIHEATFEDGEDMRHMAKLKQHTSISEALGVGVKMNANNLLLTHFSQRYCISNYMDSDKKENLIFIDKSEEELLKYFMERSIMAWDFLTINPQNIKNASSFNFVLNRVFLGNVGGFNSHLCKK